MADCLHFLCLRILKLKNNFMAISLNFQYLRGLTQKPQLVFDMVFDLMQLLDSIYHVHFYVKKLYC